MEAGLFSSLGQFVGSIKFFGNSSLGTRVRESSRTLKTI